MPVDRDGQGYDGTGWKFLSPYGSTIYDGKEFYYPLPQPGDRWGPWITHPNPAEPDGLDCGPGRLHVMNIISADYAPDSWWIWYVQYRGVIGRSKEKTAVRELRLRHVPRRVFWRMIQLGWCQNTNLDRANLREANLRKANLCATCLIEADLSRANLYRANLRLAVLNYAILREAYLSRADLFNASLSNTDLRRANLRRANLQGANLREADLQEADLRGADLRDADLPLANLRGAYLRDAKLHGADLRKIDIAGAILPDNWKEITIHD